MVELVLSGVRLGLPLLFAVWGAIASARVGSFNVALEGIITAGGFAHAAIWAVLLYEHGWTAAGALPVAVAGALFVGLALGWIFGLLTAWMELDQIISGVALNMLILASVKILYRSILQPILQGREHLRMQPTSLKEAGVSNPVAFLAIVAVLGTLLLMFYYRRTAGGVRATAVGKSPLVAAQVGISVSRLRFKSSAFTGVACAVAGIALAWLNGGYSNGMAAGRGYIALALALVGNGAVSLVCVVALFYGVTQAPSLLAELGSRSEAPTQLLESVPYWATLLLLFMLGIRNRKSFRQQHDGA